MQQIDVKRIVQTSPVAHAQAGESVKWQVVNEMNIAAEFASIEIERGRKQVLGVTDVSCFMRYGVKGPYAMQWLMDHSVVIPTSPNSWTICEQNTLVLRLGASEFLIEDQLGSSICSRLAGDTLRVAKVYKVPRTDAAFLVSGIEALNLFCELCSLDLSEKSFATHDLFMTQLAGISATIIRQTLHSELVYRIWCDGTYGAYMWEILTQIATELGGGAVGLSHYQS